MRLYFLTPCIPFRPTGFAWLSYGGVSLRFFGYFKEALEESMDGATYRVRRCVISFFPADGTLSVTEVRAGDSRASQGLFLSRRLAPYDRSLDICTCCSSNSTADVETAIGKPLNQVSFEDTPIDTPGKPNQPTRTVNYQEQTAGIGLTNSQSRERTLILTDLKLGHNLTLYSRTFRIFNCDPFTKRFCLSMGHDVGEAEEEPEVPPGRRLTAIPPVQKVAPKIPAPLPAVPAPRPRQRVAQDDGTVLRFIGTWADAVGQPGRQFALNFFLSDETAQVSEVHEQKHGKVTNSIFLRRQPLPKQMVPVGICPGLEQPAFDAYGPDDLIVGDIIEIYSRRFHILDCDDETRRWYSDKRACTQPASIKEQVLPKPGTLTNVPF
eukprot:GHVT01080228.1.p1 GENE.GHVT01080228.1~~GHVT01080228.1.p1  ORF type:complete len:380 (-),score=43.29 GHVT01080228.1:1803-2942(-)